jgi:hypothetical protein
MATRKRPANKHHARRLSKKRKLMKKHLKK